MHLGMFKSLWQLSQLSSSLDCARYCEPTQASGLHNNGMSSTCFCLKKSVALFLQPPPPSFLRLDKLQTHPRSVNTSPLPPFPPPALHSTVCLFFVSRCSQGSIRQSHVDYLQSGVIVYAHDNRFVVYLRTYGDCRYLHINRNSRVGTHT